MPKLTWVCSLFMTSLLALMTASSLPVTTMVKLWSLARLISMLASELQINHNYSQTWISKLESTLSCICYSQVQICTETERTFFCFKRHSTVENYEILLTVNTDKEVFNVEKSSAYP